MKANLRQLSYFVATAEHGSAVRAAEAIHISQPSISTAIKELEGILGQPLFHRLYAKGLRLTPFGKRKLIEARQLLDDAQAFESKTEAPSDKDIQGTVAFGYFSALGPAHVPALLRFCKDRHPNLRVEMSDCDLLQISQQLRDGRMEIALTYDVGITGPITKQVLSECEPYALLPQNHPLSKSKTVSLHDLAKEPFILVDLPMSREFLLSSFWQHGLEPDVQHHVNSVEMVRTMVANEHGVSLLVTKSTHDIAYDGRPLVSRPLREKVTGQKLIAAHSQTHAPTRSTALFLKCMEDYFQGQKMTV